MTETEQINDGGTAFPTTFPGLYGGTYYTPGMTLRDYFAAKAMQGIITATTVQTRLPISNRTRCAEHAYAVADAMIAQRERTSDESAD